MRIVTKVKNNDDKIVEFKDFSSEYFNFHKGSWTNYFNNAKGGLEDLIPNYQNSELNLINDLINNFEDIVKAAPADIPQLITKFTTGQYANLLINAADNRTALCVEIENKFNYKDFRKSAKASWFCEKLAVRACLYCNAQFTLAVGKSGNAKKLLFQLDHYHTRRTYPFLSLTMGNLVPCCSSCNIAKSKKDFGSANFFHPYLEDISANFTFRVDEENILKYLVEKRDEQLLEPTIHFTDKRVSNHIKEFSLDHIYNKHTDIIEELVLKFLYYNDSKILELRTAFGDLKLDKSTIDRFILGNYTLDSEINNRPLSKLSKDIGKQLKIIK